MERYRAVMVANGDAGKRVWPTEFGWASGSPQAGYEYATQNTEAEQAESPSAPTRWQRVGAGWDHFPLEPGLQRDAAQHRIGQLASWGAPPGRPGRYAEVISRERRLCRPSLPSCRRHHPIFGVPAMMHHRTPLQSKRIVTAIVIILTFITLILAPGIPCRQRPNRCSPRPPSRPMWSMCAAVPAQSMPSWARRRPAKPIPSPARAPTASGWSLTWAGSRVGFSANM